MMESHEAIRQRNRQRRAQLTQTEQQTAAQLLANRVTGLVEFEQAQHIAVYFAVHGEIDLAPVIDTALSQGKQIYLPNLDCKTLRFSPYFPAQSMRINRFRLPEPDVDDSEMRTAEELDLVLAPLVGFDDKCNRIGMGGGFYDRSFAFRKDTAQTRPLLIGVAHECQRVADIVPQEWDVRLDMIATDQALYGGHNS